MPQPVSFELTMQPEGDVIRLFLRLDGHFQVGLPGLSAFLGPSNTEQLQNDLQKNGIKTTRAPLFKFADSKGLQALFWGHDAPAGIEKSDTLFLYDGEETRKAISALSIDKNADVQTKTGLVIIFDEQDVPVLSAEVDYSIPVSK